MRKPETLLDKFREEEGRINADVTEAEKYYNGIILEQERKRDAAKAEREKVQGVLAGMIADFEKIEAEEEAKERARLDAQGMTRKALNEGKISGEEFYRKGITEGEIIKKAQAVASEKLAALRDVIRAHGVELLKLEVIEWEAAYEIDFGRVYPARAMLERLKALAKNLEANLSSSIGMAGSVSSQSTRDAKRRALDNATGKRLDGDGWRDFDLQGLRRLRLDPCFPVDQLPKLEEIIVEARTSGRSCCRIMIDPRDKRIPVNVMWG